MVEDRLDQLANETYPEEYLTAARASFRKLMREAIVDAMFDSIKESPQSKNRSIILGTRRL
jgi:hypothetical protein